jgi:AP-2 complex subunit beta-1
MQDELRTPPPNVSTSAMSQAQEASPVPAEDDLLSPSESSHTERPIRQGTLDSEMSQEKPNPPPKPNDPYAMLDSAFGGYVADQPRPVGGRPGEFDDLLL